MHSVKKHTTGNSTTSQRPNPEGIGSPRSISMKIAVISDIHSNPTALLTILEDVEKQKCDRIVCLGDIVGYGYDPNGCIDICRERRIECLLGNHDASLVGSLSLDWFNSIAKNAIMKQKQIVTAENKDWLRLLPYTLVEQEGYDTPEDKKFKIAFAHGELVSSNKFNYINGYSDAALEFSNLVGDGIRVLFVGHTHYGNIYSYDKENRIGEMYIDLEDEINTDISQFRCSIVNVGSVGYPRNQPYSIYGIYDTESHIFKHRILPFDFDNYIQRMQEVDAPLPLWLQAQKKRAEEISIGFR